MLRLPEKEPAGTDPAAPHQLQRSLRCGSSFQAKATPAGESTLIFFFKEKAPHLPRCRPRRPGGSSAPARPARSRRTGRRRAPREPGGEGRPARCPSPCPPPPPHHDRPERWCYRLVTASRSPGARRSPSPRLGPGGRGRVGRGPGPGGGEGTPTPGGEGARAAQRRLPSRASEARGWALRARGPQTSAFPRASGWQVVGDGVDPWARLQLRRNAQGRHRPAPAGFRRGLGLACPSLAPADCSRLHISGLMNCPGRAGSKTLSCQGSKHRPVFEPLRNSRLRSPGGPRP